MKKTKYDVLFSLFTLKSGRLKDIAANAGISPSSARQRLAEFEKEKIIERKNNMYLPNKLNKKTWLLFDIIKFCRNRGINYNVFLSESMAKVIAVGLSKKEFRLSDFKGSYKTARQCTTYLSRINLLFVVSKKPLVMKLVRDPVLEKLLEVYDIKTHLKKEIDKKPDPKRYGELETLLKEYKKLSRNISTIDLDEEKKIEFTSASTQLEGNTFTLEQAEDLIKKDIIPQNKKMAEAMEVKNYYAAVNHMLSSLGERLEVQDIIDIHRMTVFNLSMEGIRKVNVSIRGNSSYKTASPSEILPLLDKLCQKINDFNIKKHSIQEVVEFATYVHNEFQYIHPFEDGNSRTTRVLWNYVLMRNGFPLINIYANTREEYLSLTKLAKERNDQKLNSFLMGIVIDNLNKRIRGDKP